MRSGVFHRRLALCVTIAIVSAMGVYQASVNAPVAQAASNPIVIENQQAGSTLWQIPYAGYQLATDAGGEIKGYASATSVNKGGSIALKVSVTPAQDYTIDIFRFGDYGGAGGRLMRSVGTLAGTTQAACPGNANGTISCSWATAYTLTVPTTWTSGIYLAVLTNTNLFQNYIIFVVRDDSRSAQILYQQPVTTYEAYNNYPNDGKNGKSLYTSNSYGAITSSGTVAASKVSFDRPYTNDGASNGGFLAWEADTVRWLERSGYDVSYSTDVDTHTSGSRLLNYRAVLSVGHDEYWSKQMYDAFQTARDNGVSLGFLGANNVFWQIRFESSNRVIVCYKSSTKDPTTTGSLKTIRWRSVGRPEQALIGIQYSHDIEGDNDYVVTNASHFLYRGTGFANGDHVEGIVGGEGDRYMSEYPLPTYRRYDLLSKSPYLTRSTDTELPDYANSSFYQAPSLAWVFAVGSFQWSWGLNKPGYVDSRIQQTTANALASMLDRDTPTVGAPTVTLKAGEVAPPGTVPTRISWTGSDASTVIDFFVLQQSTDGGAFTEIYRGTSKSTVRQLAPGHTYRFRVTASDVNYYWSGWSTGPLMNLISYQDNSGALVYSSGWKTVSDSSALGGTYRSTTTKGASVKITTSARTFVWIAPLTTAGGQVSVYVDGALSSTVSLQSSSKVARRIVLSWTWPSLSTHTYELRNAATGALTLDAFVLFR